jgi:mono/diheme cytochrome c family protein
MAPTPEDPMRLPAPRWSLAVLAGALALAGFCVYVYYVNAQALGRSYAIAPVDLSAATDAEAVGRGRHLADVTGCTDCHRADLRGGLFGEDDWLSGRYYASNLTLKAQRYSDQDIARIVRTGVRPDGHGLQAMPSFGFVRLTDAEMADVIAFVRSLPAGGGEQPAPFIGPLDQWHLWRGDFRAAATYVAEERAKMPADAGPAHAAARHLAGIVCAECHGGDLKGNGWDSGAPDLIVAAAYTLPLFVRLLRTGIGADGKEHGLMTRIAHDRLHRLTDDEIATLHAYLAARSRLPRE